MCFVGAVPPDIVGEEQNVSVLLGQALELRCRGSAVPPPRLAWLRDGRPLLEKPGLSISADGSVLQVNGAARAAGAPFSGSWDSAGLSAAAGCEREGWQSPWLTGCTARCIQALLDNSQGDVCENKIET